MPNHHYRMAAATTSRCQCCTRFSARAPSSFTTLRADSSGTMWLTPSSTAFSMVQSIFSAVLRHCARPSRRRGGGSAGRAACSVTVAGFVEATCARIVADSDLEMEWRETEAKARALLRASELVEEGLH